jgi:hypothetical protein
MEMEVVTAEGFLLYNTKLNTRHCGTTMVMIRGIRRWEREGFLSIIIALGGGRMLSLVADKSENYQTSECHCD